MGGGITFYSQGIHYLRFTLTSFSAPKTFLKCKSLNSLHFITTFSFISHRYSKCTQFCNCQSVNISHQLVYFSHILSQRNPHPEKQSPSADNDMIYQHKCVLTLEILSLMLLVANLVNTKRCKKP